MLRLLDKHGVATMRTIEQKISDAGPFNQRINPHILTSVRTDLVKRGQIDSIKEGGTRWYFSTATAKAFRNERLALLAPIHKKASAQKFTRRVGDALEISVYRSLFAAGADFQGRFRDLDDHGDDLPYSKEEPPSHIGKRTLPGDLKLDFHYRHETAGWAGIECKNIREWLYPNRPELRQLMVKAFALNCIPVLIGRRIHPSTVFVFGKCGLIIHQNFNQLLPASDADLAADLKHKNLMGFFDIRASNEPDARMLRFVESSLPTAMPAAREKWKAHADIIERFVTDGDMSYAEFAGRIGRRARGEPEDGFEPPPEDPDDYGAYGE
jgi:hypothetical protein